MDEKLMDVVKGIVTGITTLKEQKISSYIGRFNLDVDDSNKIAWMFIRPLKYSDNLPENSVPVSRNSSLGIKLQKVELGKTFSYVGFDGLKRSFNHTAIIYNKSDLVNNTINIYNDDTEYRYRYVLLIHKIEWKPFHKSQSFGISRSSEDFGCR